MAATEAPEAIVFADAHLDPEIWSGRPIRGDSFHAFRYIVDHTLKVQAGCLIGAGDLIDVKRPPPEVVEFLRRELDRLQQADIPFYYVEGQHEKATPPWLSAVHDWPQSLHQRSIQLTGSGRRICGLSWTPADQLAEALNNIEATADVLVCHQVWEEFMGSVTAPEGSFSQIPHVSMVFTGDYHKTVARKLVGSMMQELQVYSPGATHLRSIAEPPEHRFALLYEDGSVKWKKIPGRKLIEKSIAGIIELEIFLSEWKQFYRQVDMTLPPELQMPLLRIRYQASMPEVKRRVQEVYGNLAHLFWDPYFPESREQAERKKIGRELRVKGPAGCLEMLVPKTSEHYKPLLRLLQAVDKKAELLALKQERGV